MQTNYCSRCAVDVHGQHAHCPLCGKQFSEQFASNTTYPKYVIATNIKQLRTYRFFQFVSICVVTIAITINILTWSYNPIPWSPIIAAAIIYLWTFIRVVLLSKKHIGKRVVQHYLAISFLLIILDLCTGFYKWSTTYVIPLSGIATSLIILTLCMSKKSLWKDDIGYLLSMILINITFVFWYFIGILTVIWPMVAAFVFSFLLIVGMLIFNGRSFKEEMQKRFHW